MNKMLLTHKKFTLNQLIRLTWALPGDAAECGSYDGASSYLILTANQESRSKKTRHIFDSFEGLSEPSDVDEDH